MPRPASAPTRLGRALLVAQERSGTLPLRDALAVELHHGLPESVSQQTIDDLSHRLAKVALSSMGAALIALARDA